MALSAFVVRVPSAEPLVGDLRARFDATTALGVPAHITLLVPFMAPADITPAVLALARQTLANFAPFRFSLRTVGRFPTTAYLAPEPAAPFIAMTRALAAAFPDFPPYGGEHPAIVPHLSVAHGDADDAATAAGELQQRLDTLGAVQADCDAVVLLENSTGRWRAMHEIPLASPRPATQDDPPLSRTPRMHPTETDFELTANDGMPIEAHRWQGGTPRAIVQLAHGMGEHSLRYRPLAGALTQAGYVVYANEHRGHGKGAVARNALGDFGPRGFDGLVDDMALLSRHARDAHPGLPLILIGHSMGSFAAQYYLARHSGLLAGAALSGTTALDLLAAAAQTGFKLEDLNAALPDVRTPFDWLSRDPAQVDAYIADPLCGFTVTPQSRMSMFAGLAELAPDALRSRIRPALPLYLFIGDQDPVSNKAEWFHPLVRRYREAGLREVSCHVFGGARHETLNETNRDEVVAVLLAWIANVVRQG